MKLTCILMATGRVQHLNESLASFLNQDYEDKEIIIVNVLPRQTLVLDHPNLNLYNCKEFVLPMRAKNYAAGIANGEVLIAWDEMAIALPSFLSSIAAAIEGREWCWLDKELVLDAHDQLTTQQGTEFSFAFTKAAWLKCGPYAPGINGSSDRNLISRLTAMYPGENTAVNQGSINLIRIGTPEERERTAPIGACGQIKLNPVLNRDYQGMVEVVKSRKRENRTCLVLLGRNGDILNLLPILKEIHDKYETPYLMVSEKFAELLDGVSYVKPFITPLDNSKLGAALTIAKQSFSNVLNVQIWGEGFQVKKETPCYNMESWRLAGFLQRFNDKSLRPVFDRRDLGREKLLLDAIRGYDGRPMILCNFTSAISSPCQQCGELMAEMQKVWSDYNVVNLADHKAHRIYDFLTTFEKAACLVSIDTAWLHLAAAADIPVVAITNPKGEGWAATAVRGNLVHAIPYDKVLDNDKRELHEAVAAALERPQRQVQQWVPKVAAPKKARIFHLVDRRDISDQRTRDRIWKAQSSWDSLYERGDLIPAHCYDYPRRSDKTLGDSRPLPYLKDLLEFGMKQCRDDDILLWSNDDNLILDSLPDYLKFHISVYGPCSIFRTELRGGMPSLNISAESFARNSHERHIGRDGFAFSKAWLEENWDILPDSILGAKMFDVHLAIIIRKHYGIETTNQNIWNQILPAEIPLGFTGHLAHTSAWLADSKANDWNGKLFLEYAAKNCPSLKVTAKGDLA